MRNVGEPPAGVFLGKMISGTNCVYFAFHLASLASIAAMRSGVFGWLSIHAGVVAPRAPVSVSSFLKSVFCGSVPIPALTSNAEA